MESDMNKVLPRLQQGRFDWLWFHDMNDDVVKALVRMDGRGPKHIEASTFQV
jgi:salicylate hydroxylase